MNIHRTPKNKGLEENIIQHVCDYDQNHNIERQIIRVQSGNQRRNIFRDQGIADPYDQGDCRPQKWNGVQKSRNNANGNRDSYGNSKENQSNYENQAYQKTFYQCPA